ncbi:MAG: sigma 54-interacting transcriptional regulator [Tepidanaerobacteraceae bacterium]|jgi:PAS domain S-box-containing protein|nr:sigma 54-interacting transcriptional regulator [Thermoanaerobacterales bacterium]
MKLHKLQVELQQIAEAIMAVTGMDVTILDNNLKRIAGTGKYRAAVGKLAPQNSVFEKCITTGREYVIEMPRNCDECEDCHGKSYCLEEAEVCCPIKIDQDVTGIIGLIAFNQAQKESFLEKQKEYMNFIRRMSSLISSQLKEQRLYEELRYRSIELHTIIDAVDEGIIAVDHQGKILCINQWAKSALRIKEENIIGKKLDDIFPKNSVTRVLKINEEIREQEEAFTIGKSSFRFLISVKPIIFNSKRAGAVATFKDFEKLHRSIIRISENTETITFDKILGKSPNFLRAKEQAKQIANQDVTVLILGESGTGKELFARAIHYESSRKDEIFMPINCGAIPDSLIESELFGYEKGSFTGASPKGKIGKFEMAQGGTVFLDEIGDLPLHIQVKLLRVLQQREVVRIGGLTPIKVDVRIIAATNKDLFEMVHKGEFREDLFYRLNVVPIIIPPLRDRPEDILDMAESFISRYNGIYNKKIKGFSDEVRKVLINHSWDGNVRELENLIEYGVIFEKTNLLTFDTISKKLNLHSPTDLYNGGLKQIIKDYERSVIRNLLNYHGHDTEAKRRVAQQLKISTATLYRKLNE